MDCLILETLQEWLRRTNSSYKNGVLLQNMLEACHIASSDRKTAKFLKIKDAGLL